MRGVLVWRSELLLLHARSWRLMVERGGRHGAAGGLLTMRDVGGVDGRAHATRGLLFGLGRRHTVSRARVRRVVRRGVEGRVGEADLRGLCWYSGSEGVETYAGYDST